MSWQVLLTISIITYGVAVLVQRILLREEKSDPVAYGIILPLINALIVAIFSLLFTGGFKFPENIVKYLPNIVLMTVIYALGIKFEFKALKKIEASEFTILFATRTFFTIIGSMIFLNESFLPKQALGAILVFASVIIVSFKKSILAIQGGEIHALIAAFLFGLGFVNDAYVLQGFDSNTFLFLAILLPALMLWIMFPKSTKKMKVMINKGILSKSLLLAILFSLSGITYYAAYKIGRNAAQLSALDQTATIVTVILAIVILKEKTNLTRKIIGAGVSFLGVILLK